MRVDRVSLVETTGSTVCFLWRIWYYLHPVNRGFNIHLAGFQLRATKLEWKLALKRPSDMSLQKLK